MPIQTKRGCVFKCVYCTYLNVEGWGYRLRDPESVVDEMAALSKVDVEIFPAAFAFAAAHDTGERLVKRPGAGALRAGSHDSICSRAPCVETRSTDPRTPRQATADTQTTHRRGAAVIRLRSNRLMAPPPR